MKEIQENFHLYEEDLRMIFNDYAAGTGLEFCRHFCNELFDHVDHYNWTGRPAPNSGTPEKMPGKASALKIVGLLVCKYITLYSKPVNMPLLIKQQRVQSRITREFVWDRRIIESRTKNIVFFLTHYCLICFENFYFFPCLFRTTFVLQKTLPIGLPFGLYCLIFSYFYFFSLCLFLIVLGL